MTRIDDVRLISELLTTAEQEARAAGDEQPGAEHLLLAATITGDDTARVALARWDASPDRIRAAIVAVHEHALAGLGLDPASAAPVAPLDAAPPRAYRSDANAQAVFTRAGALARSSRPRGLRTAHVLLALTESEAGTARRVLRELEIEPEELAAAATAELERGSTP
jgi:ATP-dependent Clp protease ATP-binding subunit ClpA